PQLSMYQCDFSSFGSTGCPGCCHSTITTSRALTAAPSSPTGGCINSGPEITLHPACFQAFARSARRERKECSGIAILLPLLVLLHGRAAPSQKQRMVPSERRCRDYPL